MNIFQFILHITVFIDRYLVPLIFAIAFITFIWGVFTYFIRGGAETEEREKGKQLIMWGLVGFVVMIAVWGIVNLLVNSLRLNPDARPRIPTSGAYEQAQGGGGQLQGGVQGQVQGQVGQPVTNGGNQADTGGWWTWGWMQAENDNTNVNGNSNFSSPPPK